MRRADSEGDTQHFEHASNYGHVTIGIQKFLVISWMQSLRWRSIWQSRYRVHGSHTVRFSTACYTSSFPARALFGSRITSCWGGSSLRWRSIWQSRYRDGSNTEILYSLLYIFIPRAGLPAILTWYHCMAWQTVLLSNVITWLHLDPGHKCFYQQHISDYPLHLMWKNTIQ